MNQPNQMPYGYYNPNGQLNNFQMPNNFNNQIDNNIQYQINELKQKIRILEQRVEGLEKQNIHMNPTPYQSSIYMV